ncbi:MAG: RnfABCDGE type electron transport complex subunit D [Clostridia bacterium]
MEKLIVSSSPHFNSKTTTSTIMRDVLIALTPAAIASIIYFGLDALILIIVSVGSCVLCEYVSRKVMKRKQTIGDLSAVVTGLLLAFNMPASVSPIIVAFGAVIAIVVVKQMFGGIGQNFVNPALTARIVLMNSFPSKMTAWTTTFDGITTATPLGILGEGTGETLPTYFEMFIGNRAGCLGETCILALLIGGIYLVVRKIISPVIPVTYMATAFIFSALLGRDPIMDLLAGGLVLGAVFMATDYATSPIHTKARVVFAIGCGIMTILIREFASLPEGVSYSIMIMNILVPLIERVVKVKPFGFVKKSKEATK